MPMMMIATPVPNAVGCQPWVVSDQATMSDSTPAMPKPVEPRPRARARFRLNHRVMTVVSVSQPARFMPIDIIKMIARNNGNEFATGNSMKPPPMTRTPTRATERGLNRSISQPWAGLRTPAASCDAENALDMANLLQPKCSSNRSRYCPNVKPNAAPVTPWNATLETTIHQP